MVSAGVIIENKLSFGTVVVTDNSTISNVTVNLSDGKTLSTNKMLILVPGQLAEFTLINFTPYSLLNISANILSSETSSDTGSLSQFSLTNLTIESTVTVDNSGMATLFMGGTLSTSGNGTNSYISTNYHSTYNIVISY